MKRKYAESAETRARLRRWYLARRKRFPLYATWQTMKARCMRPSATNYKNYGGRGIGVYPAWVSSFQEFDAWITSNLGPRPDHYSLDRIDNDGNYEPGNIRWAPWKEQIKNRRQRYRRLTQAA
jgi:hypothetical protein